MPALEPAYELYLKQLAKRGEPALAAANLIHIENAKRHDRIVAAVARSWLEQDPSAAEAWIATADLSPALLKRIRAENGAAQRQPTKPAD